MTRFDVQEPALHRRHTKIEQIRAGVPVRLDDGSLVLVRALQAGDGPLLIDGFARLSPNSRRMRFLVGKNALTARELHYFTDVDHRNHEALGALDAVTGRGVGVARFVRDPDDVHCAEVAITVVDEWQRRGLGSQLLARLAQRARTEGIERFNAVVAADNVAVLALLRGMDAHVELTSCDADTMWLEIYLRADSSVGAAGALHSQTPEKSEYPTAHSAQPAT